MRSGRPALQSKPLPVPSQSSSRGCFVATFKVYASYSKFIFRELRVAAVLHVDKNNEGKPCMHSVDLDVKIVGAPRRERAQLLVEKTLMNGFILQSLKTRLVTKVDFED